MDHTVKTWTQELIGLSRGTWYQDDCGRSFGSCGLQGRATTGRVCSSTANTCSTEVGPGKFGGQTGSFMSRFCGVRVLCPAGRSLLSGSAVAMRACTWSATAFGWVEPRPKVCPEEHCILAS